MRTLEGRGSKSHQVHAAGEPGLELQVTDIQAGDGVHHSTATTDGTARCERDWSLGDVGLSPDLPAANQNDFNLLHLALAACPFFLSVSGHKIKSHILKVPNSVIILASQSTCNWPIKLLRKKLAALPK